MALGRCPCTFGAHLGVFGHTPGRARPGQRPRCGDVPCLQPPQGGCERYPNVPLCLWQCTPAALLGTPNTGGAGTW